MKHTLNFHFIRNTCNYAETGQLKIGKISSGLFPVFNNLHEFALPTKVINECTVYWIYPVFLFAVVLYVVTFLIK